MNQDMICQGWSGYLVQRYGLPGPTDLHLFRHGPLLSAAQERSIVDRLRDVLVAEAPVLHGKRCFPCFPVRRSQKAVRTAGVEGFGERPSRHQSPLAALPLAWMAPKYPKDTFIFVL